MPDQPLTFAAIQAMDDETLNLTIEAHCYPQHYWTRVPTDGLGAGRWRLEDCADVPGRLWSSAPHLHYTTSWDKIMALFFAHGEGMAVIHKAPHDVWVYLPEGMGEANGALPKTAILRCLTDYNTRRALCQMLLWCVVRRKETPHA